MRDILQRMIARSHAALSPIEPVLPSIFAPGQSAEIDSQIEPEHAAPSPSSTPHPELEVMRPAAYRSPARQGLHAEGSGKFVLLAEEIQKASASQEARDTSPGRIQVNTAAQKTADTSQSFDRPAGSTPSLRTHEPVGAERSEVSPHLGEITQHRKQPAGVDASPVDSAHKPTALQATNQSSNIFQEVAQPVQSAVPKTEVFISIGHIEVRSAPAVQPRAAAKPHSMVTVQEYLQRRRGDAS